MEIVNFFHLTQNSVFKKYLRKELDTVESLSVEVKGSKVANFTVLVTLLPTFVIFSSVGVTKSRTFATKSG